jgi:predicted nucleic acid-binding protein
VTGQFVVNASPLILLGAIDHLTILTKVCERMVVPESVAREIAEGGQDDPAARWLNAEGKAFVQPDAAQNPLIAAWGLGKGETAVLSFALEQTGCEAVLDDRAARKCAQAHGIPYRGTIGIVVMAKRRKLVPAVAPILDDLARAGLWRDDKLFQRALREAGEDL